LLGSFLYVLPFVLLIGPLLWVVGLIRERAQPRDLQG
jgi:hypothetical protein